MKDLFKWDLVYKSSRGNDENFQESDAQILFLENTM